MIKFIMLWILFVVASLAPAAYAGSDVLTTAPVLGDRVTCLLANAGSKPVTVTVELVGTTTFTLATNAVTGPGGFAAWGAGDDDLAYCRFTITSGRPDGVRASACGILVSLGEKCASSSDAR